MADAIQLALIIIFEVTGELAVMGIACYFIQSKNYTTVTAWREITLVHSVSPVCSAPILSRALTPTNDLPV